MPSRGSKDTNVWVFGRLAVDACEAACHGMGDCSTRWQHQCSAAGLTVMGRASMSVRRANLGPLPVPSLATMPLLATGKS